MLPVRSHPAAGDIRGGDGGVRAARPFARHPLAGGRACAPLAEIVGQLSFCFAERATVVRDLMGTNDTTPHMPFDNRVNPLPGLLWGRRVPPFARLTSTHDSVER